MTAPRRRLERNASIEVLGRALARGRRSGAVVPTGLDIIASRDDAEAVLDEATLAYDARIEGFCLAATTKECGRLTNCDEPLAAPMFACARIPNGGNLRVDPSLLGLGAELQFRFGRAFPIKDDVPGDLDSLSDAIVSCHIGFQILGRRSGYGTPMNGWTALADFGLAAHHVRGDALYPWREIDLRSLRISVSVDGNSVALSRGYDVYGHPLGVVSWLARSLATRGAYIEAGSFVAIGSCTGLTQLVAGHVYTGHFGGNQQVTLAAV